ncbi:MAG TPA: LysE family translocator [Candidatus Dormibacteraeota bacterium]|nr:LysE family translocator [Candidatus Dormibacteraeota bacterium]
MARALVLGFLIGFPIAASPGPIFSLVLRRTLSRGSRSGLVSGLGVATGDAIYAGLAAFGVAAITNVLLEQRRWLGLGGGVAIALIGLRTIRSGRHRERLKRSPGIQAPHAWAGGPAPEGEGNEIGGLALHYGSMVALTLGNPATILSFIAVFAGFGLRVGAGWQPAVALVAGVMLGSALWWLGLAAAVSVIRRRLTPRIIRGIGIVAGLALIGFGTVAAASSLVRPG